MSTEQPDPPGDRVVVGVDGSEQSQHALRWARFLAHTTGATVAVAAWAPLTGYGFAAAGWTAVPTDWDPAGDARRGLIATLDEVLGEPRPPGARITVGEGTPAKVLAPRVDHARTRSTMTWYPLADTHVRPDASLRQLGLICAS